MRPLSSFVALALTSALLLSACGSSGGGDEKTTTTTPKKKAATVKVVYATPDGEQANIGKTLLTAGGTTEVAKALAGNFDLPWDMKVLVRNSSDTGPYYDPDTRSINLDYGFAWFIFDQVKRIDPKISEYDRGASVAAINSFIYVHEFAHLLIDAFDLPITGREEDAADQLAARFMVKYVDGGDKYAFDAAQFFYSLAEDPSQLQDSDFFDEHSLDAQRAFQIVCWIAGSSEKSYKEIQAQEILDEDRLQRCPAEWEQIDQAWDQLLTPHYSKTEKAADKTT